MATDPTNVARWKHKFGFHNRGVQWDSPMSKWAGGRERLDTACGTRAAPQAKCDDQSAHDDETGGGKKNKERRGAMTKKPRDLEPLVLESPAEDKKLVLEIRGGLGRWPCQTEDEDSNQNDAESSSQAWQKMQR